MFVEILLGAGLIALFALAVWTVYAATEVIEDVNEPGLYRKLKDREGKQ